VAVVSIQNEEFTKFAGPVTGTRHALNCLKPEGSSVHPRRQSRRKKFEITIILSSFVLGRADLVFQSLYLSNPLGKDFNSRKRFEARRGT
jgi:hypothetical protein